MEIGPENALFKKKFTLLKCNDASFRYKSQADPLGSFFTADFENITPVFQPFQSHCFLTKKIDIYPTKTGFIK